LNLPNFGNLTGFQEEKVGAGNSLIFWQSVDLTTIALKALLPTRHRYTNFSRTTTAEDSTHQF